MYSNPAVRRLLSFTHAQRLATLLENIFGKIIFDFFFFHYRSVRYEVGIVSALQKEDGWPWGISGQNFLRADFGLGSGVRCAPYIPFYSFCISSPLRGGMNEYLWPLKWAPLEKIFTPCGLCSASLTPTRRLRWKLLRTSRCVPRCVSIVLTWIHDTFDSVDRVSWRLLWGLVCVDALFFPPVCPLFFNFESHLLE